MSSVHQDIGPTNELLSSYLSTNDVSRSKCSSESVIVVVVVVLKPSQLAKSYKYHWTQSVSESVTNLLVPWLSHSLSISHPTWKNAFVGDFFHFFFVRVLRDVGQVGRASALYSPRKGSVQVSPLQIDWLIDWITDCLQVHSYWRLKKVNVEPIL